MSIADLAVHIMSHVQTSTLCRLLIIIIIIIINYNSFHLFKLLKALRGDSGIVECAFVPSDVTSASYFSTPLELGVSCLWKQTDRNGGKGTTFRNAYSTCNGWNMTARDT